jgi:hypothetical protein
MSSKLSLDRVKKGVLLYLIIFRLLAVYRHVRARGLVRPSMTTQASLDDPELTDLCLTPIRDPDRKYEGGIHSSRTSLSFLLHMSIEHDPTLTHALPLSVSYSSEPVSPDQFIIRLLLLLPSSRLKIASELATLRTSLTAKLAPPRPHLRRSLTLPPTGLSPEELEEEMGKLAELGAKEARERGQGGEDWKEGRVSGAVYSGQEDVEKVIVEAFAK